MGYLLLTSKKWHDNLFKSLANKVKNKKWLRIKNNKDFCIDFLNKNKIEKIFIPHWSHKIPEEIYNNYECILFHMTDLPYGRGGSPLQNLIVRGHKKTKLSALKVVEEIDAGPIYLKKELLLEGTAHEIFTKASKIIETMIVEIIHNNFENEKQSGIPVFFKRRTEDESNIKDLETLKQVYDHIRMLDCKGYPNAYLETKYLKIKLTNASIENNQLIEANVKIIKK